MFWFNLKIMLFISLVLARFTQQNKVHSQYEFDKYLVEIGKKISNDNQT